MHIYCLLTKYEKPKRSKQSKSALYKQALFSFPSLSFFATAVLYLLVFEFLIVIVNHVKGIGPFIDLWSQHWGKGGCRWIWYFHLSLNCFHLSGDIWNAHGM